jgi:hypothetical protein
VIVVAVALDRLTLAGSSIDIPRFYDADDKLAFLISDRNAMQCNAIQVLHGLPTLHTHLVGCIQFQTAHLVAASSEEEKGPSAV